jgi:Domain of unknown function (DUF4184)
LSALVIGSMVPDAAYYLPMPEHFRRNSHTLLGTFSTSLPAGIILWLIFYRLAPSAVFLLPAPHREAIAPQLKPRLVSLPQAFGVAFGVLIGAWSHVLWDSFTHVRGWIVQHVALLQTPLLGTELPAYKCLQYFSSVFGLCVLFYVYNKWMEASEFRMWIWRKPGWRSYLWFGIAVICLVVAGLEGRAITAFQNLYREHTGHYALKFFVAFVRDFLVALCAAAIIAKMLGYSSSRQSRPDLLP